MYVLAKMIENGMSNNTHNGSFSILELLKALRIFTNKRWRLIILMTLSGLALGWLVDVAFNPWIAQIGIRNINNSIDLTLLRSIDLNMKSNFKSKFTNITDSTIIKKMTDKLDTPNWIEKNILPILSFTRNDLTYSSLPEKLQNDLSEKAQILYLNVQVADNNASEAEAQARLLTRIVLLTALQDSLIADLTEKMLIQRKKLDADYSELAKTKIYGDEVTERYFEVKAKIDKLSADELMMINQQWQNSMMSQSNLYSWQSSVLPISLQAWNLEIEKNEILKKVNRIANQILIREAYLLKINNSISDLASNVDIERAIEDLIIEKNWVIDVDSITHKESADNSEIAFRDDYIKQTVYSMKEIIHRFKVLINTPQLINYQKTYSTNKIITLTFLIALSGILILYVMDQLLEMGPKPIKSS